MTALDNMLQNEEIFKRIENAKKKLGSELLILAHYYQSEDVVRFADYVGDSLQLAQYAAQKRDVKFIVFCSVSFMADMTKIISSEGQEVLLPATDAHCPLAEMAYINDIEKAWNEVNSIRNNIIPVVYVNSTADLKAFCGRNGGTVCTSANAEKVFKWVFSQNASIFFFPDQNLGRNISRSLGIKNNEQFIWNPKAGVKTENIDSLKKAKVILWKGFCYVHKLFLVSHIKSLRNDYNGIKVIVHPECVPDVCAYSDFVGSTSFIKKTVDESEPGTRWAVGTEWNLVDRLAKHNPDKQVIPIGVSTCCEMKSVTPQKLLYVLEGLVKGEYYGRVNVPEFVADDARLAIKRMFDIL